jgi:hypothetical protein
VAWAHPASCVSFTFSRTPFLLMLKYVLIMEITEYTDTKVNTGIFLPLNFKDIFGTALKFQDIYGIAFLGVEISFPSSEFCTSLQGVEQFS